MACGQYKDKEGKNDQKLKNGPKNVNFQNFEKCFGFFFSFSPKNLPYQKIWFHNKKYGQGAIAYFRLHKRDQNLAPGSP